MVLEACRALRLRVPEDVAVVGVDNDPVVCNFCDPALTSVSRNDYQVGYEAAALLDELMAGGDLPRGPIRVPPEGVVQCGSTDTVAVEDSYVVQAIAFMRGHVRQRFGVEQLLRELSISRRNLEYRIPRQLETQPLRLLESNPRRSRQTPVGRTAKDVVEQDRGGLWIQRRPAFSHRLSTTLRREPRSLPSLGPENRPRRRAACPFAARGRSPPPQEFQPT